MKLLVQKVSRATVEIDGLVESRIGAGLVLTLALGADDTAEKAQALAAKVLKLKLWPELTDLDETWKTSVVDNGYEVLVILQQSLCAAFPQLVPSEEGAMELAAAKAIYDDFVKKLQSEYQEEMVVSVPLDTKLQVETTGETPGLFELESEASGAMARTPVTRAAVSTKDRGLADLEPEVAAVTETLRQIPTMTKSKATLESCKIYRIFSLKKFRAALSEAMQSESDDFAEALECAAKYFSRKQLEQITSWTGLTVSAPARDEENEGGQDDLGGDELDDQLAQLQEELDNPEAARKRKRTPLGIKEEAANEPDEQTVQVARTRPDWKGRAAPNTPAAAAARQWVANRQGLRPFDRPGQAPWMMGKGGKKGGKGLGWGKGGPRQYRSLGIASLDTSARLHGNSAADFEYGQTARYSDRQNRFIAAKQEDGAEAEEDDGEEEKPAKKRAAAPPPRLPKGTPTLAPMTPAPANVHEDL